MATNIFGNYSSDEISIIEFTAYADNLKDAAVLLREAVGNIKPINDSLLGRKPKCAAQLNLDLNEHQKVRKFEDEDGLAAFKAYLSKTLDACPEGPKASVSDRGEDGKGFVYGLVNSVHAISIERESADSPRWMVDGVATFRDPRIVMRQLERKGFKTAIYGGRSSWPY